MCFLVGRVLPGGLCAEVVGVGGGLRRDQPSSCALTKCPRVVNPFCFPVKDLPLPQPCPLFPPPPPPSYDPTSPLDSFAHTHIVNAALLPVNLLLSL